MASNGNGKCCICSKAVYATELMVVDEREYHKGCFRCNTCNRPVTITSYTSYNGEIYCKTHKPSIDSKNPEQLSRLHSISYDSSSIPSTIKHIRTQTAPPLVFNKPSAAKFHEGDKLSSENVCSLKNIFEKNESAQSAPATPQSPTFVQSPTTCDRIESLKKEIQQNNNSNNEILYRPLSKTGSIRLKKLNAANANGEPVNHVEKMDKINKILNEIDENWNEFEKTNSEYIKQNNYLSRNTSLTSIKDRNAEEANINKEEKGDNKVKDDAPREERILTEEELNEEISKCEKEMDEIIRNFDSYINNYYERKNEAPSAESSIESFLEEYSIEASVKPSQAKETNLIGGINNIFKKNSEKGTPPNLNNSSTSKTNILWIRAMDDLKYDKVNTGQNNKKQSNTHKKYLTSSSLQDYLNIAFETRIQDKRTLEDVIKSIEQYCSEIKHGCESTINDKSRPLIESLASPLKFLVETLNSLYNKIRGIIPTVKLTKLINLLVSFEDILIKEGFQHIAESQMQNEFSELLIKASDTLHNYLNNIILRYKKLKDKMNVFERDTFRIEIISNQDDVIFSYQDFVLDRLNTDAKLYRNTFLDQEHRNYVGYQSCLGGPFIISIKKLKKNQGIDVKAEENAAYQAIVRIKDVPEIIVLIPSITVRSQAKLRSSTSWKSVLQAIHPEINVNNVCKIKEKDKTFQKRLMDLDEFQCVHKFKFGILYAKEGQTSEEEMFNNENGSRSFYEFLSILGDTVELKNYTGYAAGLDCQYGNTGNSTVVTKWRDYDITYHVSTMLPYDKDDRQQIQRKRHIGNDIVCFIFLDGKAKFDPATIISQFLHIFIVVQPLQPEESLGIGYRVTVVSKMDVPIFGPPLPPSGIFHNISSLREFLMAKSVNGENAAYMAPKFYKPQLRTRGALIEDLVKDYYEAANMMNSSLSLNNVTNIGISNLSQSPTNTTIKSLDEGAYIKSDKKGAAPAIAIAEEDDDGPVIKKAHSASNMGNEDNDIKLNRV